MAKITITRALSELKRLKSQIEVATGELTAFVATGVAMRVPNTTAAAAAIQMQSSYDRVNSLIKRAEDLRNAVHASNAVVRVELGGKKLTVAEAINLKTTQQFRQAVLTRLEASRRAAIQAEARATEQMEQWIATQLQGAISKTAKPEEMANNMANIRKSGEDQFKPSIVGLKELDERIAAVRAEYNTIDGELDFVLNESNARTEIEVE